MSAFLGSCPAASPGSWPLPLVLLARPLSSQGSEEHLPCRQVMSEYQGCQGEERPPPLADALSVLFRLFARQLEKGDGDNQNHASSLEKMSNHTKV